MHTSYLHMAVQSSGTRRGDSSRLSIARGCPIFESTPDDEETGDARLDTRKELPGKDTDLRAIERAENEGLPQLANQQSPPPRP
jgi:hypothetical protein